ncbi:MAG: MBL fold metallo-hydrolase [Nitrospinae bacterium]|nr:MBL fold metallo-hydrolase [Nitrospinota bacterium]
MLVKFWGVRGSIPSGGKETAGVGGNTTCVEIRCGDELIIIDTGTGARNLGKELMKRLPLKGRIFYTHVHWDHIQGMPFFAPMYVKGNEFEVYGGTSLPMTIEEVLKRQMTPPCFPVKIDIMQANLKFHDLRPGDVVRGDNYKLTLLSLFHPDGSYAYKVESGGQTLVFATDVEPLKDNKLDANLLRFSEGADFLIYDAQYTEDEYFGRNGHFPRIGWGHSTMPEAVRISKEAGVKNLILFHHDPTHDDNFIKNLEKESRGLFPNSSAAYEGMEIDLGSSTPPGSMFD